MWAPGYCLDGCLVLAELEGGFVVELVPDHELVVVTSRSELLVFVVPLQTADLLLVTGKLAKPLIRLSDITVVDGAIPRSRSEYVLVPCKGADTSRVAHHGAKAALRLRIPDLHLAAICADSNM